MHPYAYALNNPALWTDHTGLHPRGPVNFAEGLFIHAWIEQDYLKGHAGGRFEFNPNAGFGVPDMYIDIVDFTTSEIYEIKHVGDNPTLQLAKAKAAMDIQYKRQAPWRFGTGYPVPNPSIVGYWPVGLDSTYNPATDGVWGIRVLRRGDGEIFYEGVQLSRPGQPVPAGIPAYDADDVEDFVQSRWPRARKDRWRQERVRGRLSPLPPIQQPLPGFGLPADLTSTVATTVLIGGAVCITALIIFDPVPGDEAALPIIWAPLLPSLGGVGPR